MGRQNVLYRAKWSTYASVIPQDKRVQSKATTHDIERNHCHQRHWFGRFKRKSIIVSKAKEMVDLTMGLFARFWVSSPYTFFLLNSDNEASPQQAAGYHKEGHCL